MKSIPLRQAREKAGLTQDGLADLAGVPQSVISRLESGVSVDPAFRTVVKLANALHVDPLCLQFGGEQVSA